MPADVAACHAFARVHPLASDFFPILSGASIEEGPLDAYGRRSWVVAGVTGADALVLQRLFARAGTYRGFMFRVPGTDKSVVARFETQTFRIVGEGAGARSFPIVVRQIASE